ncbi:toxin-antitoxin system YwqK family antitoxin [Fodinibius sp. AD559]|uniref:toxin-antitoxin system YwqK family antitoxin n=1 Tax=Fodinibius sp. AD559 TaxID=3424179 RepID=UPI004046D6D5
MRQLTSVLFILLLLTGCSQEISEEYTGHVEEIFSDISVSEELNLYIDESGQPANGHYRSNYQNGSLQADITFSDGMISEGKIFHSDGVLTIRYTTENGLMKTSYYTTSSQPRMVTLHGDDLSDRIAFQTWDEDGTQRVKTDQTVMKQWYKNGQPQFEMQLKDGKLHGKSATWYENGQIKSEQLYTDGVKHGTFKEWDKEGNVTSEQVYDMGELVTEK